MSTPLVADFAAYVATLDETWFLDRVDRRADGCWIWRGTYFKGEYGRETRTGYLAHRIAWAIRHGDPGAACVLHRCDNPPCCNPAHLFLGTRADNMADKVAKGRQPRGEATATAKLTPEQVEAARRLRARLSQRDRAWLFGVAPGTIQAIDDGASWNA